jgi:hypothetical protein
MDALADCSYRRVCGCLDSPRSATDNAESITFPPLVKGGQGGWARRNQLLCLRIPRQTPPPKNLSPNPLQHPIKVLTNLRIQKPHNRDPKRLDKLLTLLVIGPSSYVYKMSIPVQLDARSDFGGEKVDHKRANTILPPEFAAEQLTAFEPRPEDDLGVGHGVAELSAFFALSIAVKVVGHFMGSGVACGLEAFGIVWGRARKVIGCAGATPPCPPLNKGGKSYAAATASFHKRDGNRDATSIDGNRQFWYQLVSCHEQRE